MDHLGECNYVPYIVRPDAESHGAYVFCCVGTLFLCEEMTFNLDELAMWIHERQTTKGGYISIFRIIDLMAGLRNWLMFAILGGCIVLYV